MQVIDKNLFIYLTKRAGFNLQDVADWWGVPLSGVYKRINGTVELRRDEMETWMDKVGYKDAGPVFFPAFVAGMQPDAAAVSGGADGI